MPCSTLKKTSAEWPRKRESLFFGELDEPGDFRGFKEIERTRRKGSFIKEMEMSADRTWHSIGLLSNVRFLSKRKILIYFLEFSLVLSRSNNMDLV